MSTREVVSQHASLDHRSSYAEHEWNANHVPQKDMLTASCSSASPVSGQEGAPTTHPLPHCTAHQMLESTTHLPVEQQHLVLHPEDKVDGNFAMEDVSLLFRTLRRTWVEIGFTPEEQAERWKGFLQYSLGPLLQHWVKEQEETTERVIQANDSLLQQLIWLVLLLQEEPTSRDVATLTEAMKWDLQHVEEDATKSPKKRKASCSTRMHHTGEGSALSSEGGILSFAASENEEQEIHEATSTEEEEGDDMLDAGSLFPLLRFPVELSKELLSSPSPSRHQSHPCDASTKQSGNPSKRDEEEQQQSQVMDSTAKKNTCTPFPLAQGGVEKKEHPKGHESARRRLWTYWHCIQSWLPFFRLSDSSVVSSSCASVSSTLLPLAGSHSASPPATAPSLSPADGHPALLTHCQKGAKGRPSMDPVLPSSSPSSSWFSSGEPVMPPFGALGMNAGASMTLQTHPVMCSTGIIDTPTSATASPSPRDSRKRCRSGSLTLQGIPREVLENTSGLVTTTEERRRLQKALQQLTQHYTHRDLFQLLHTEVQLLYHILQVRRELQHIVEQQHALIRVPLSCPAFPLLFTLPLPSWWEDLPQMNTTPKAEYFLQIEVCRAMLVVRQWSSLQRLLHTPVSSSSFLMSSPFCGSALRTPATTTSPPPPSFSQCSSAEFPMACSHSWGGGCDPKEEWKSTLLHASIKKPAAPTGYSGQPACRTTIMEAPPNGPEETQEETEWDLFLRTSCYRETIGEGRQRKSFMVVPAAVLPSSFSPTAPDFHLGEAATRRKEVHRPPPLSTRVSHVPAGPSGDTLLDTLIPPDDAVQTAACWTPPSFLRCWVASLAVATSVPSSHHCGRVEKPMPPTQDHGSPPLPVKVAEMEDEDTVLSLPSEIRLLLSAVSSATNDKLDVARSISLFPCRRSSICVPPPSPFSDSVSYPPNRNAEEMQKEQEAGKGRSSKEANATNNHPSPTFSRAPPARSSSFSPFLILSQFSIQNQMDELTRGLVMPALRHLKEKELRRFRAALPLLENECLRAKSFLFGSEKETTDEVHGPQKNHSGAFPLTLSCLISAVSFFFCDRSLLATTLDALEEIFTQETTEWEQHDYAFLARSLPSFSFLSSPSCTRAGHLPPHQENNDGHHDGGDTPHLNPTSSNTAPAFPPVPEGPPCFFQGWKEWWEIIGLQRAQMKQSFLSDVCSLRSGSNGRNDEAPLDHTKDSHPLAAEGGGGGHGGSLKKGIEGPNIRDEVEGSRIGNGVGREEHEEGCTAREDGGASPSLYACLSTLRHFLIGAAWLTPPLRVFMYLCCEAYGRSIMDSYHFLLCHQWKKWKSAAAVCFSCSSTTASSLGEEDKNSRWERSDNVVERHESDGAVDVRMEVERRVGWSGSPTSGGPCLPEWVGTLLEEQKELLQCGPPSSLSFFSLCEKSGRAESRVGKEEQDVNRLTSRTEEEEIAELWMTPLREWRRMVESHLERTKEAFQVMCRREEIVKEARELVHHRQHILDECQCLLLVGGNEDHSTRLLNKKVNMAKQLLQEEKLRKRAARELPVILQKLQRLVSEWEEQPSVSHCEAKKREEKGDKTLEKSSRHPLAAKRTSSSTSLCVDGVFVKDILLQPVGHLTGHRSSEYAAKHLGSMRLSKPAERRGGGPFSTSPSASALSRTPSPPPSSPSPSCPSQAHVSTSRGGVRSGPPSPTPQHVVGRKAVTSPHRGAHKDGTASSCGVSTSRPLSLSPRPPSSTTIIPGKKASPSPLPRRTSTPYSGRRVHDTTPPRS